MMKTMETPTDCGPVMLQNYYSVHHYFNLLGVNNWIKQSFPDRRNWLDNLWDHPRNHWKILDEIPVDTKPLADCLLCINKHEPWIWHWVLQVMSTGLVHNGFGWVTEAQLKERYWVVYSYNHERRPMKFLWNVYGALANTALKVLRKVF